MCIEMKLIVYADNQDGNNADSIVKRFLQYYWHTATDKLQTDILAMFISKTAIFKSSKHSY